MSVTIGIDFGTTNTCAAVWTPQGERVIDMVDGKETLPSVVALARRGVLVGHPALRQIHENPEYTFRHIKRFLAKPYTEETHSYQMAEGPDGMIWWKGPTRLWSGPELVAQILGAILTAAEDSLGTRPTSAIMTVPVGFHEPQKLALAEAARMAGLQKVEFYAEPVAAALAFRLTGDGFSRALVYDWGGGTFDVAILHLGKGAMSERANGGLANVGGADIDQLIVDYCSRILAEDGHDVSGKPHNLVRLARAAEEAKILLSTEEEARIYIDNFLFLPEGVAEFRHVLTQEQLEELATELIKATIDECRAVMARANLKRNEIKHIILIGGQTRMPMVHDAIEAEFGKKPISGVKPEYAVALGAAIRAAEIDGRIAPSSLARIASATIGVRRSNELLVPLISKGQTLPAEAKFELTTADDGQAVCSVEIYEGEASTAMFNSRVVSWHEPVDEAEAGGPTVPCVIGRDDVGAIWLRVGGRQVYPEVRE